MKTTLCRNQSPPHLVLCVGRERQDPTIKIIMAVGRTALNERGTSVKTWAFLRVACAWWVDGTAALCGCHDF